MELFPSIVLVIAVTSIVIAKFIHSTILVTISAKRLLPTKLQFKLDKNPTWLGSWMLLNALFHCRKGSVGLPLKNVMYNYSGLLNEFLNSHWQRGIGKDIDST
jgi:TRAP-type C4-dicarboxylate transport system permease large subunit